MRPASKPKWWQRRRVRWPLWVLLTLGAAGGLAIARSPVSRVVVYNETGARIAELTVSACGQSRTFQDVGDGDSVRLNLAAAGGESDIALATNGVAAWRGEYIEPRGGYRAILRLRHDGEVESSVTISWWQSSLHRLTTAAP